jgi:hypothetical protein
LHHAPSCGIVCFVASGDRLGEKEASEMAELVGSSVDGYGVRGTSTNAVGVVGETSSEFTAVWGHQTGNKGPGVFGSANLGGPGVLGTSDARPGVNGRSNKDPGVLGESISGPGVLGTANAVAGVNGRCNDGPGVLGQTTFGFAVRGEVLAPSGNTGIGVVGAGQNGIGVLGTSQFQEGVNGRSNEATGVRGESRNDIGVAGRSISDFGVYGVSDSKSGVVGHCITAGVAGVRGSSDHSQGAGVRGEAAPEGTGVLGTCSPNQAGFAVHGDGRETGTGVIGRSGDWIGVVGASQTGVGVHGESSSPDGAGVFGWGKSGAKAGIFNGAVEVRGNLTVSGALTKQGGGFRIDHPRDPANKYLNHSFVESSEMKNVYDGAAQLEEDGTTWVDLPEWFEALNGDFRYQLTAIGGAAPNLHVAEEISENRFRIAGGEGGMKVCWQVTGSRKDAWAAANRFEIEEEKPQEERGRYLQPDLYDAPEEQSVMRARMGEERLREREDRLREEPPPVDPEVPERPPQEPPQAPERPEEPPQPPAMPPGFDVVRQHKEQRQQIEELSRSRLEEEQQRQMDELREQIEELRRGRMEDEIDELRRQVKKLRRRRRKR